MLSFFVQLKWHHLVGHLVCMYVFGVCVCLCDNLFCQKVCFVDFRTRLGHFGGFRFFFSCLS